MKHDYLYDIIEFWLSNEEYEYYLKELFTKHKKVFELKEKPVIEVILDHFINSCHEYIENKEVVSKDYYVRLFNKMYNSEKYDHKSDYIIKEKLNELKKYISKRKMSDNKKSNLIESINNLGKQEKKEDISYKKDKQIEKLTKQLMLEEVKNQNRIIINEPVFMLKSNNYNEMGTCYSIVKNSDNFTLNIHIIDLLNLIYEDSYLYKEMMNNNMLNPYIINALSYKENEERPSITISIEVEKNGKVKNFKVFKSIVKPSFTLNKTTSNESLRGNTLTKKIPDLARLLNNYYGNTKKINNLKDDIKLFNHILNEVIGKNIYENDYPFIYKVHMATCFKEAEYQIANLNYYLFRIPYEDYKIIYDIICNKNNNKAFYSCTNLGHYAEHERYKLELKPFTFVGYNLLSLINDLYIKNKPKEELIEKYSENFEELVKTYNKRFFEIDEKPITRKIK